MAHLPTPKWHDPHQQFPNPKGNYGWEPSVKTKPTTLQDLFNDMFFLGFNDQISRWATLAGTSKPASFPPYNLIKISDDEWKVELAIAGYSKDDIDITVEKDQLFVASKEQPEEEEDTVVYQGIAKRQWKQRFILGEYMEVTGAALKDGLLTITVERNLPEEAKPKTIKIK